MPTLLVIDDEPAIHQCLRLTFHDPEITLVSAGTAAEGLEKFAQCRPDVVVTDIHLPDRTGLEMFKQLHQLDPKVPVIVITGQGTADTAIEAMRLGAYEYILKPLDLEYVYNLVGRALEIRRLMQAPAALAGASSDTGADALVGRCAAMQDVYKAIGRVASQDVTVLILGESGTGKELVARALYQYSRRAAAPLLAVNCAAIPEALLESELFGHEKGAFTGAEHRRIGKFEQCNGGTLFLDEIGDMTPLTQAKVLRALQDQRFERVGGNETIQTDVRLLAATNRDLEDLVRRGAFRSDLYYRLNTVTISLPPLRERIEDLPLLVEHFLARFRRELGKDVRYVAPEALDLLRHYAWPGNVRELQSVLKQAMLQASAPVLVPEFLPAALRFPGQGVPTSGSTATLLEAALEQFLQERQQAGSQNLHGEWQALSEAQLFARVLRQTGGNVSQAAKLLGISRPTLRTKIAALGIAVERSSTS